MCKSLLISVHSNNFLINSFCVFIHTLLTLFTVAPNITSVLFHFGFFIFFRCPSFLLNLLSHTTSKSEIWLSETVDNHFVVFNLTTELETHYYDLCFVRVKGRHICSASQLNCRCDCGDSFLKIIKLVIYQETCVGAFSTMVEEKKERLRTRLTCNLCVSPDNFFNLFETVAC